MNTSRSIQIGILALGLGLVGAGCKSSTEVAKEKATSSAQTFQQMLGDMPPEIDRATAALTKLSDVRTTGAASTQTLADLNKSIEVLTHQAQRLTAASDDAVADSQRFFTTWLKESRTIKDETQRRAAIDQIKSREPQRALAKGYLDKASKDFRKLVDGLKDASAGVTKNPASATNGELAKKVGPIFDSATATKNQIARLEDQINTNLLSNK